MRCALLLLAGCATDPLSGDGGASDLATEAPADLGAPPDLGPPQCGDWVSGPDVVLGASSGWVVLVEGAGKARSYADFAFVGAGSATWDTQQLGPCRAIRHVSGRVDHYVGDGQIRVDGCVTPCLLGPDGGSFILPSGPMLWSPGARLRFRAAGDVAPPFQLDLPAPTPTVVTTPQQPVAPGELYLKRGKPIALSWAPASEGWLVVELSQPDLTVECAFPARFGAAIVPSTATEQFPAHARIDVTARTACDAVVTADGWRILVEADALATADDGSLYAYQALLQ